MSDAVRAFVALPLPESVTSVLLDLQRQVESATDDFYRWSPVSSMHLTLYFLGECPADTLAEVKQRLEELQATPIELEVGPLLCLPDANVPKILAVALAGDVAGLRRLQQKVQDKVSPIAPYKETRLFQPHITFGRLRRDKPSNAKQVKRALAALSVPAGVTFSAKAFCLMKSDLADSGAAHEVLSHFPLS